MNNWGSLLLSDADIPETLGEDIRQSLGEDIPVGWAWLGSPQLSRDNVESTFQDSLELNGWGNQLLLDEDIRESLGEDIPVEWAWLGILLWSGDNVESTFQDSPELNG